MSKKVKTIEINSVDDYGACLTDSVNQVFQGDRVKPQGYVEIYEEDEDGNRQLVGRQNLVLYWGREWLAQRIVNIDNPNIPFGRGKDEFICWFGLGDGGVISGDPFDPQPPVISDSELASQIMINPTDSSAADYHVADPNVHDFPDDGYYKIPFDIVTFEQDAQNDDTWLVVKITVTVGTDDANGKQLSEAGLFTAESNAGGYGGTNPPPSTFNIFSRVTFPSIVKTLDRRIIFNWFLYV